MGVAAFAAQSFSLPQSRAPKRPAASVHPDVVLKRPFPSPATAGHEALPYAIAISMADH